MKTLIIITILVLSVSASFAATDTLKINLKSGETEIILTEEISKVEFDKNSPVRDNSENTVRLSGNYPNPFSESTTIRFELDRSGTVLINIYNAEGQQINQLSCTECTAGSNTLEWNCNDNTGKKVPSGTYYYEVRFEDAVLFKNMILVK